MTTEDLLRIATSAPGLPLPAGIVDRVAAESGQSVNDVLDGVARRVAEGYVAGEYDFELGDPVMNAVFGYTTVVPGAELSPFAWGIFEAFDQGEFRGEEVTRTLVDIVLRRGYLILGDGR
jgi:hypothetical protein